MVLLKSLLSWTIIIGIIAIIYLKKKDKNNLK